MARPIGALGERLVKSGYITEEQLTQALEWQQQDGTLLGETLVRHGLLKQDELSRFVFSNPSSRLGEALLDLGYITRAQLSQALDYQRVNGNRLGAICVQLGFLSQAQLDEVLLKRRAIPKERLGDMLVTSGVITAQQLESALDMQLKSGGRLGDILLYLNCATEEELYRALANQAELSRPGELNAPSDRFSLPYDMARRHNAMVLKEDDNAFQVAVQQRLSPEAVNEIEAFLGKPIEQVLMSQSESAEFWERVYRRQQVDDSIFGLYEKQPENSAIVTFTSAQRAVMLSMLLLLILALAANWKATLLVLVIIAQVIYLMMAIAKFLLVIKGVRKNSQLRYTPEEIAAIDEKDLPVYTLLIPVYKEKEVIRHLIQRIQHMDYPKYKLDVLILLEENDQETIDVIRSMKLPSYFNPVVVPASKPQTKPKACNYGLLKAKGDYVVIYDAEDRPEPDQLKKAYLAFKELPEEYVCIQAKLNYFNSRQNALTKLFTQEYSMWFELLLVGIMQIDIPIPLGGTSNHFKMSFLRQVGGWDPFNVTEDADLGVRLYKYHYRTAILDSRTWEEANSNVKNWIRQRSRWIKGYMQTFFVHMRHPITFTRTIGFKGLLGYIAMIFGTPFLPLINPIFWGLLIIWLLTEAVWIQSLFPGLLYYVALTQFVLGNFIFVYINMIGSYCVIRDCTLKKQRQFSYNMIRFGLATPIYWVLMSIAAYKALFQLFAKPFYWEKTHHGLTSTTPPTAASASPPLQHNVTTGA